MPMIKDKTVAVTDCDHKDMKEEEAVFARCGLNLDLFQCKTEQELMDTLPGYPAVLNQYAPFTEKVFAALPDLKLIVRYGVGVNNIDLDAASRHKVSVCSVPDYGIQEVAGHAFALMMALTRKLLPMDEAVKAGRWDYAESIPLFRYREMTVGIIGLGRIGSFFAELVRPLGCRILGFDIADGVCGPNFVESVDFGALIKESDVISIHSNLETSRHLIGKAQLADMKPTACLVNVSRGGIIDEAALADALNRGALAGAGIDVTETEPLPAGSPLRTAKNIILTPHMAWYSEEASSDLKTKAAEEAARYLTGRPLKNQVNCF
jgi:D-3-phosphoglycerate dehydrogenase